MHVVVGNKSFSSSKFVTIFETPLPKIGSLMYLDCEYTISINTLLMPFARLSTRTQFFFSRCKESYGQLNTTLS